MSVLRRLFRSQQAGLLLVIVGLGVALSLLAGTHADPVTGATVNNFLNSYTLIQTATDASFFAIMAVGATIVIIAAGIDLSVGSVYALAGVGDGAGDPRAAARRPRSAPCGLALGVAVAIGFLAGLLNGAMVVGLRVHPFIITLGTMWILRGIAFVSSKAESILLPEPLTRVAKASLGMGASLYPVPMLSDAAGQRRRRDLPVAHRHGPARLRHRRQRRGEPLLGAAHWTHPARCVRGFRRDRRRCRRSWAPAFMARRPVETRPDTSYT